jgi:hypothetical protein
VTFYRLDIHHEGRSSERRLGPGAYVLGGGLTADLLVPALHDAEVCELLLPEAAGEPLRLRALIDDVYVDGRPLQEDQLVSGPRFAISVDGVDITVAALAGENANADAPSVRSAGPATPRERAAAAGARAAATAGRLTTKGVTTLR